MTPAKLLRSLDKHPPHIRWAIPAIIAIRCINAAKTELAKTRLVDAAIYISRDEVRKIWSGEARRFMHPRPTKKPSSFISFIKNLM